MTMNLLGQGADLLGIGAAALGSWGLWSDNVTKNYIIKMLDIVQQNKVAANVFKAASLALNTLVAYRTQGKVASYDLAGVIQSYGTSSGSSLLSRYQEALITPNIGGIPISSSSVETSREIEISEQMVVIQSKAQRTYMTDNAVPRLKEWSVEGYLTTLSTGMLENGLIIKPTLIYQQFYLDTVASSRRPVIFKDNNGQFHNVQITRLQFQSEASYNNAVKLSCELKEYNPYITQTVTGKILISTEEIT